MGVLIASANQLKQQDEISAIQSIINAGGIPTIRDTPSGRTLVYSARHDALAQVMARYLRGVWGSNVTYFRIGFGQMLNVTEGRLLGVQRRLEGLKRFVDEWVADMLELKVVTHSQGYRQMATQKLHGNRRR
jgi:nuclear pore complex protein Nup155